VEKAKAGKTTEPKRWEGILARKGGNHCQISFTDWQRGEALEGEATRGNQEKGKANGFESAINDNPLEHTKGGRFSELTERRLSTKKVTGETSTRGERLESVSIS